MKKRCVITGLGIICPVGNDLEESWNSIISGKTGLAKVTTFSTEGCYADLGGEVFCDNLPAPEYDRSARLCIKAAEEALHDADLNSEERSQAGVIVGSCIGGAVSIDEYMTAQKEGAENDSRIPNMAASSIANHTAAYLNLNGVTANIVNACAAGTMSIAYACDLIRSGEGDIFLAGGTDPFSSLAFAGFHALHALSEECCSPFNHSHGITLGEGSGILVVEEYEHAVARGAKIYAEVAGYGVNSDAYHITAPDPSGQGQMDVIRRALGSAEIEPSDISYVNAHGTGTPKNDEAEFLSLHTIFDGTDVSISSTKSMTGHCLGAAGAVEAVFTVKAVSENVLPPTIGYTEEDRLALPEKAGNLDFVVNESRNKEIAYAMSNSFAFGGTNASIIFSKDKHETEDGKKDKVYITGYGKIMSDAEQAVDQVAGVTLDMKDFTERGVKLGIFRKLDKFGQLQLVSGIDAFNSAGIQVTEENERRIGTIIGTSAGPVTEVSNFQKNIVDKGCTAGSAFTFPNTVYNAAGGHFSIFTGTKGYCATVANGTQAGLQSVAYACDVLGKGNEDIMLASGTDEGSDMVSYFYSHSKINGCRILGEGSSTVVLETGSSADKRQAHKYAEVAGYALTHSSGTNAYTETDAMEAAVVKALANAGMEAGQIDRIYAVTNNHEQGKNEIGVLEKHFPGKTIVDPREQTGDCRAASANAIIVDAAKAIDASEIGTALTVSYGCGSYTAIVLK
ncbi:MAG: beta-ketoacyl-[Lachnospiraceae bacterium]|nr:beta-ketoacyl-[acyl-carrier-protein] synthase family protein [Lachnospiraceae bacterium]